MPADLQERTPGVYVRADHELPHELDMLWSNSRLFQREERSPVLSFVAGLLLGILVTTAVFMLIINRPHITTNTSEVTTPVADQAEPAEPASAESKAPASAPRTAGPRGGETTYTVQSGDTLGGIAYKVYGSSAPQYVDKIQRANNLPSPDAIQIDQKLVIPPKNY